MLRALVAFSLKFRGVVLTLACVLLVYGFYLTINARLDVFPNFVQPQVAIQTECPGLSPEQVELLVTTPIETMVNGLGEMESLRSESIEGLSVITAVFKESTDVFRARQTLGEKLAEMAGVLPASVKTPRMTPLTSSTMDLLKIGLISTNLTPMQLRSFADWTLKPRLLAVPGVAKCSTYGGEVRQLQIQVSPERLAAYGLSLSDVIAAARVSTGVMGAGFIETRNQRITLQTEGQALGTADLQSVIIGQTNGVPVRLQDVARVVDGAEPKFGDAIIQGRPAVLLTMSSQYNANTLEVTRDLEAALDGLRPIFEKEHIEVLRRLHRPATFIEISIANMKHSLVLGAIFVAVVLFTMLGSIRTAFISLVAIPLSLLAAIVVLQKLGITINTITLGGLAIALGEVVDDSIIDVENIFRRLREYRARKRAESPDPDAPAPKLSPRELFDVVLSASLEVRSAVVYATFIVALVFLPVLTLTGLQGSFFAPLALSYILAIMASLVVALTVTPALASITLTWKTRADREPRLQHWFKTGYGRIISFVSRWPKIIIGAALAFCIAAACCLPFFGGELLPQFREGHFVLQVWGAPGTSLPEMARLGARISTELLANPHIDTVSQQIGRAELGEDAWAPNRCEFHVELKPTRGREQQKMTDELREILEKFPGIEFEVLTFLGDRISETITGETEPVVVNITGDDLDLLDEKAREVAAVLRTIPGNADVKIKAPKGSPRMVIRLRNDRLSHFGFRPVEVMDAIQTAYHGGIVAQTHRQNQVVDIAVVLGPQAREDPEAIGSLLVTATVSGTRLPLKELADIYPTSGRFSIQHEAVRRRQVVTCATRPGRDVVSFTEEAKNLIAQKVTLPTGTTAEVTGAAEAASKAQSELLLNSAVAAVGIIMLLSIVLHNVRNLFLVLLNVPFALAGGIVAVWVSNALLGQKQNLSIGSLVGFVTLFGITMRNSIMMISHFEHLVAQEGMTWGEAAAVRGASERLMPILITAIVTALGLLPLATGAGEAGREIEGPMAIVILGGLVTSTALNLLILPTLTLKYGRFSGPKRA